MEKNFLRKIWAHDAPWYMKATRSAATVAIAISLIPYAAALLPGEPIPEPPARSLRQFYRAAVDFNKIKLHSSAGADAYLNASGSEAITVGSTILLKQSLYQSLKAGDHDAAYILAHEVGHVYQNEESYMLSFLKNLWENIANRVSGGSGETLYDYSLQDGANKGWKLSDYGIEQQGDIFADYYNIRNGRPPKHNRDDISGYAREKLYRDTLSGFLKERGSLGSIN